MVKVSTLGELRRYWSLAVRRLSGVSTTESLARSEAASDGAVTTSGIWELGSEVDPVGFEPGDLNKRADVVTELGLQPEEFLVQLVDSQGGRLPQRAFRDYTSWSETLISRVLQDMEDEGKIVRVRRGKEKVVCLPDHVPASGLGSPPGRDDPSPA